ncbi:MAG TPA: 2-oxo acid dehydrogenase subunit E2 [Pirellulales bacterium]|nr:2-oxo acid dehydrogenase subunit E2 [Pirellulales bacterium]
MSKRVEIFAPRENVNDDQVTIVELYATDGDFVDADARLLVVETSKSTCDVHAPSAGYVKFLVALHDDVAIESPLCALYESAESTRATSQAAPVSPPGELAERPTENGTAALRGQHAVQEHHLAATNGHAVAAGVSHGGSASCARGAIVAAMAAESTAPPQSGSRASREAQALMEKAGLGWEDFPQLGMIRARDVRARLGQAAETSAPATTSQLAPRPAAAVPKAEPARPTAAIVDVPHARKKLSRAKRTETVRLASTALASQVSVLAPSRGIAARLAADPATAGQLSSRLIFESARLLKQFADLNATYDAEHVVHYAEVNVGYALDLGQGLKVPVFAGADRASLDDIHDRKQQFILKYLSGELASADLDRGTFTISDLGDAGAWMFEPLISVGQAAILGVGAEQDLGQGQFVYPLILAFDHRLTDGLTATRFLHALSERMAAHQRVLERQLGGGLAATAGGPICRGCQRTLVELRSLEAQLVRTVGEDGQDRLLCTICIAGW